MKVNVVLFLAFLVAVVHGQGRCCNDMCLCSDNIINCDQKCNTNCALDLHNLCNDAIGIQDGTIRLSNNNIERLDLKNLPSSVTHVIARNSNIGSVLAGDSTGVTGTLKSLDIRGNRVHDLGFVGNLTQLESLDVSLNDLTPSDFRETVMRTLGKTLKELHVGSTQMETFPSAIGQHLPLLQTLEITNAPIVTLGQNAFQSFKFSLQNLTIQHTNLQVTPIVISQLVDLKELHFDHNHVGDYGVLESSFGGLKKLKTLTLKEDDLTVFPEIVKRLPSLLSLSVDSNVLLTIRDQVVNMINESNIQALSLRNCSLDRIPGALAIQGGQYLTNIEELHLDSNLIQSIDRDDLHDLEKLRVLTFSNNPLHYISDSAFHGITNIEFLDLSKTNIVTIPLAIKNLEGTKRLTVNLEKTQIECTCSLAPFHRLAFLSGRVELMGECDTISMKLNDYMNTRVPCCPNYDVGNPIMTASPANCATGTV